MTGPMIGPWRRGELAWAAATTIVSLVLFAFSDASMGWIERLPLLAFVLATVVLLAMPWLRARFGEGHDQVVLDPQGVSRRGARGARERIEWSALDSVVLVSPGPDTVLEPAYWLLLDASGRHGCAIPNDADGIDALKARLHALPGYRASREPTALADRSQRRFELWRRSA